MVDSLATMPAVPNPAISETEADEQLAANRYEVTAIVAKADHRFLAQDHTSAAAFYTFAVKCASSRGVHNAIEAKEARRASELLDWLSRRFRHHILSSLADCDVPHAEWPDRFKAAVDILLGDRQRDVVLEQFPQLPRLFFYPDLPYVDFVDPTVFEWRDALESNFVAMREEAARLLADTGDFKPYVTRTSDKPQGDVHGLLENSDWSSLYLWTNGAAVEENARRCPTIFRTLMDNVPLCEIGTRAPAVLLSLLRPNAHIPPHTGMLNLRYICHLPLIVPAGCRLRVGERTVQWREGRILAFDDTVEHEAYNDSAHDRLVLIFDVWNPHLSATERSLCRTLLEAVENYR